MVLQLNLFGMQEIKCNIKLFLLVVIFDFNEIHKKSTMHKIHSMDLYIHKFQQFLL